MLVACDRPSDECNEGWCDLDKLGGHSSAGRAPALHAGGREFDPPWLHQTFLLAQMKDSIERCFQRNIFL